jgi:hypothetical protein
MTANEAIAYWQPIFTSVGVDVSFIVDEIPKEPLPDLPTTHASTDIIEWNPRPHYDSYQTGARQLESTVVLDCMLNRPSSAAGPSVSMGMIFCDAAPARVPGLEDSFLHYDSFWDVGPHKLSPNAGDAFVATALLMLDELDIGEQGSRSKVLAKPFPNAADVRFPAMYLDNEFLECTHYDSDMAFSTLRRYRTSVPATLLTKLVETMFLALGTGAGAERDAFRLLKIFLSATSHR